MKKIAALAFLCTSLSVRAAPSITPGPTDAPTVGGFTASQFMRADTDTGTTGHVGMTTSRLIGAGKDYNGNSTAGGAGTLELYNGSTGATTLSNTFSSGAFSLKLGSTGVERLRIATTGITSFVNSTITNHVTQPLPYAGTVGGSTYGYLLLAKAYTSGSVAVSMVEGTVTIHRGGAAQANRSDHFWISSKTAYQTEYLLVHRLGGTFASSILKTCKITYGGVVYHALKFANSGGNANLGVTFNGISADAGITTGVVADTDTSAEVDYGIVGLVLDSTGKLGVGTLTPATYPLDVRGTASDRVINIETTASGAWLRAASGTAGYAGLRLQAGTAGTLAYWTAGMTHGSNDFVVSNSQQGDASKYLRIANATGKVTQSTAATGFTGNAHEWHVNGALVASMDASGNIEHAQAGAGVILKSPNGTRYKLTVSDAGELVVGAP